MPLQFRKDEMRSTQFARTLRKQMTDAEVILWSRLRDSPFGMRFRRQHPIGPYIGDFACPMLRLIVEVDGGTHSTVKKWLTIGVVTHICDDVAGEFFA